METSFKYSNRKSMLEAVHGPGCVSISSLQVLVLLPKNSKKPSKQESNKEKQKVKIEGTKPVDEEGNLNICANGVFYLAALSSTPPEDVVLEANKRNMVGKGQKELVCLHWREFVHYRQF